MDHTIDSRQWRRSRFCGSGGCLEVAHEKGAFYIRDSKHPGRPVLAFTTDQGTAFLAAVREGTIR